MRVKVCYYLFFLSWASSIIQTLCSLDRRVTKPAFVPRKIIATSVSSKFSSSSSLVSSMPSYFLSPFSKYDDDDDDDCDMLTEGVVAVCRGGQQWDTDYYNDDKRNQKDFYAGAGGFPGDNDSDDDGREFNAYQEEHYFDDRGSQGNKDGPTRRRSSIQVPDIIRKGNRKIGLPLLGIGAILTVLGVGLFFNKMLMRLGNLFFVAGIPMTIGPGRTAGYFFQPKKARATACLTSGIILVFIGWPILGIILEAFGFLNLFGNMFPFAFAIIKQMPIIGPFLKGNRQKNSYSDDNSSSRSSDPDRNFDQYDDYSKDQYDYNNEHYNEGGYDNTNNNQYY